MKPKRIVVALGGNTLGKTLPEQRAAAQDLAASLGELLQGEGQLVVVHGTGPQVGMLQQAMDALTREDSSYPPTPLAVCTAMSQGYLGGTLQDALREELRRRGSGRTVTTLLTQVEVDPSDPAFQHPSKPIGAFLSREAAAALEGQGVPVIEDAGRGWRRAVPSPQPRRLVELETVRLLMEAGQVVIAGGGGGIPVRAAEDGSLQTVDAVVDKDFVAGLLARDLDADLLLILTAVEKVAIHFGKPNQRWLTHMTLPVAEEYIAQGQFAEGSMLPKVQAAVRFGRSKPGRQTLITLPGKVSEALRGQTGTLIGSP